MKAIKNILWCGALVLLSSACDGDDGGPAARIPGAIVAISPSQLTGTVNNDLLLTVRVNDLSGNPLPGVVVNWAVAAGNGNVPATSATDANGQAQASWRLGTTVGTQRVTASVTGGHSVTFNAEVGAAALAAINVTPGNQSLEAGATLQLAAAGVDAFGNTVPLTGVVWTSGNQTLATVSTAGLVTGVGSGTASITATAGGVQGSTNVTVTPGTPSSITVTPSTRNFFVLGDTATLTAVVRNTRDAIVNLPVTWSSSNNAVVTVHPTTGLLRVTGSGSAQITASVGTVTGTATVGVSFGAATVIPTPATIPPFNFVFDRELVSVVLRDARGELIAGEITWTTSDPNVAIVLPLTSSSAYIYSTGAGSATISATSGLARADLPVTVSNGPAVAFIRPENVAIHARGATAQLSLAAFTVTGAQITNPGHVWESANPNIASVTQTGVVTNISNGNVLIRALVNGEVVATRNVLSDATLFVPRLSFTSPTFNLYGVGDARQLELVHRSTSDDSSLPLPANITWSTSAANIATVSTSGVVTAVNPGNATITATGDGLTATAIATVIGPATQMTTGAALNPLTLGTADGTTTINYAVRDVNSNLIPFAVPTFVSNNTSVVRVIGTYLHAVGRGTASITATYGNLTQTFTIQVL